MRLVGRLLSLRMSKLLDETSAAKLEQYAKFSPSPVSIRHFLDHGKSASVETSYFFLRKEIPVRLANIMKELELLPSNLRGESQCSQIQDFYVQSFKECLKFVNAMNNEETFRDFNSTLKKIRARHIDTVPMMADAILRMKEGGELTPVVETRIQYFLNRLYMSRISIHMLIHQHALMCGDEDPKGPDYVGCIHPDCNVLDIIEDAYSNASFLCEQHYLATVEKNVQAVNTTESGDPTSVIFSYIPAHLHYILFELLKNALRATIEKHQDSTLHMPSIDILVVKSPCDISIKISDRGGGIPWADTEKLFRYMYTTAPKLGVSGSSTPIAGLGYGLPLSRLYARYFRGDIVLTSMDGYGTDVIIYLRALSEEASEYLPVYNHMTKLLYEKPRSLSCDWTDPTATLWESNHTRLKMHNPSNYQN